MVDYHYSSVIRELSGSINGSNKTFVTPTKYVSGTIRVIVNGQVYESNEDVYGWSETDDETVELNEAPRTGDVLQAFYQDKDSEHLGTIMVGSPFNPVGL